MIKMFNEWYFFWLLLNIAYFFALYFLLRNAKEKTQKAVLFSMLLFAFILHFLKMFIPPYSTDVSRMYRDSWFINICGANIGLFPFLFFSKNKYVKDYMFYLGILGGAIAILYPAEPLAKSNQYGEMLDIIRFYIHHGILWIVPLLMVTLKLHTLSYRRLLVLPISFSFVLCFIIINQILQSELGYIALRSDDFFDINYKNSSMIWGPSDSIGEILSYFCPNIFKTIPVGEYEGEIKYWPVIWLLCPMYVILVPIAFFMCIATNFKEEKYKIQHDFKRVLSKCEAAGKKIKTALF